MPEVTLTFNADEAVYLFDLLDGGNYLIDRVLRERVEKALHEAGLSDHYAPTPERHS